MLKGIAASEGIGIGKVVTITQQKIKYENKPVIGVHKEIDRLHAAIDTFVKKTEALAKKMEQSVNAKDAKIIRGHITMLNDPFMIEQMDEMIKNDTCAEAAAETALNMFRDIFAASEDELTRQRATDVEDIKTRLLKILLGIEDMDLKNLPPDTVLVVEDLTPSMTAELNRENIAAIVTESGGMTSHSAILSRALEIPAVLSVLGATSTLKQGSFVIVDGIDGVVIADPTMDQQAQYEEKKAAFLRDKELLKTFTGKPTVTADGLHKEVFCNIGNPKDALQAKKHDGEGVGLFRTEFLFMDRETMPSEEEQYEAYRKVADTLEGKTIIIRTLDVGGDKEIPYMGLPKEENPFLGYRAIRYCLKNPDSYKVQLRALIRANADSGEHIWIMVPMVTSVSEIQAVCALVSEICEETGLPRPKVGTMIETPAAFIMADVLAKYCDFFSIGTNDLTQYIMAADRGNAEVAYLYNTYDPAVLRALYGIIKAGTDAGITVGMCGEAAADPLLIPLLIHFGLEEFSVSPTSVLKTRREISLWTAEEAAAVWDNVSKMETADQAAEYLKSVRK